MGMFDTIIVKLHWIWCGEIINDWQTKDLENSLETFNIEELKQKKRADPELFKKTFPIIDKHKCIEIHGICPKCDKYISLQLDLDKVI